MSDDMSDFVARQRASIEATLQQRRARGRLSRRYREVREALQTVDEAVVAIEELSREWDRSQHGPMPVDAQLLADVADVVDRLVVFFRTPGRWDLGS